MTTANPLTLAKKIYIKNKKETTTTKKKIIIIITSTHILHSTKTTQTRKY